jgi:hypothetical protein
MSVREQHPSVLRRLPPTFQVRAPATGSRLREVLAIGQSAANTLSFGTRAARPARPVSTFRPAAGTGTTPGSNGEGSSNGDNPFQFLPAEAVRPFRQGALDPPRSFPPSYFAPPNSDRDVDEVVRLMGGSEVSNEDRPPSLSRQRPSGRPRASLPGRRASLPGSSPPRGSNSRSRSRSPSRVPMNTSPTDSSDSDGESAARRERAARRRQAPTPWWALDRLARGGPASMPPGPQNANPNVQNRRGSPSGIEDDLMRPNAGPAAEPAVQPPSNAGPSGTVHNNDGDPGIRYRPADLPENYGAGMRYYPPDEDEWP